MFTCTNPKTTPHQHALAAEARDCWFPPVKATPRVEMSTKRQIDYLRDLGYKGNALTLTRDEASRLIDSLLKREKIVDKPVTDVVYKGIAERIASDPKVQAMQMFLASTPDGYYAVRKDDTENYTFLRIAVVKTGRFRGFRKIQTQHGPRMKDQFVFRPNGSMAFRPFGIPEAKRVAEMVMLAAASQTDASITYALELGRCCRCNAELTDERSRWYGIGPECETHRYDIIEAVDFRHDGVTYEQHKAAML